MNKHLVAIWAQDLTGLIGAEGRIPWRCPEDQLHFRSATLGRAVICGRKTAAGLSHLLGRSVVVVSRRHLTLEVAATLYPGAVVAGGGEVLRAAMSMPELRACVVTRVEYNTSTALKERIYAPIIPTRFRRTCSYPVPPREVGYHAEVDVWERV